jgi:hypothetical protein
MRRCPKWNNYFILVISAYTTVGYRSELGAKSWLYSFNQELESREHDMTLMDFIASTNYTKYNKAKVSTSRSTWGYVAPSIYALLPQAIQANLG